MSDKPFAIKKSRSANAYVRRGFCVYVNGNYIGWCETIEKAMRYVNKMTRKKRR